MTVKDTLPQETLPVTGLRLTQTLQQSVTLTIMFTAMQEIITTSQDHHQPLGRPLLVGLLMEIVTLVTNFLGLSQASPTLLFPDLPDLHLPDHQDQPGHQLEDLRSLPTQEDP